MFQYIKDFWNDNQCVHCNLTATAAGGLNRTWLNQEIVFHTVMMLRVFFDNKAGCQAAFFSKHLRQCDSVAERLTAAETSRQIVCGKITIVMHKVSFNDNRNT